MTALWLIKTVGMLPLPRATQLLFKILIEGRITNFKIFGNELEVFKRGAWKLFFPTVEINSVAESGTDAYLAGKHNMC